MPPGWSGGLIQGAPGHTSRADVLRSEPAWYDLVSALANARTRYPRLGSFPATASWGPESAPGQLEFYPPWEGRNPTPGLAHVEVYNRGLRGGGLESAVAGDLMHMLGAVDPRTSQPVDRDVFGFKQAYLRTMTPGQRAMDQRAYAQSGDPRPFDDWMQQSRLDAHLRGYLFPDERDEWRLGGNYTPDQAALLEQLRFLLGQEAPR